MCPPTKLNSDFLHFLISHPKINTAKPQHIPINFSCENNS